jgi:NADH dehydrogenase
VARGYHLAAMPGNRVRVAADWLLDAVLPRQSVQLGLVRSWSVPLDTASPELARVPGAARRETVSGPGAAAPEDVNGAPDAETETDHQTITSPTPEVAKEGADPEIAGAAPGAGPDAEPDDHQTITSPTPEVAKDETAAEPAKNQPGPAKDHPAPGPVKRGDVRADRVEGDQ